MRETGSTTYQRLACLEPPPACVQFYRYLEVDHLPQLQLLVAIPAATGVGSGGDSFITAAKKTISTDAQLEPCLLAYGWLVELCQHVSPMLAAKGRRKRPTPSRQQPRIVVEGYYLRW